MASTKRSAAGDEAAPPPSRLRVMTAAAPGSSNPKPPPRSPRERLLIAMRGVFFIKLSLKGRSTESERIGRLELGLRQLGHDLGQVRDTLLHEIRQLRHDFGQVHTLLCKQDSINKLILYKLDNKKGPSPQHRNHDNLTRQGTNQEGTSAEVETEGKDASIRLRFLTKMKSPVFHEDEIKSIRIGIFDGNKIIESGPLSKLKIEVLALDGLFPYDAEGSWTSKEFQEHIAYGRYGKGHVLEGKGTNAQPINGECHLGSIRFREGSCRTGSRMFIVAARVRGDQAICDRVQEAVMDPVVVRDRRTKYNQKGGTLKLEEGVQCLRNISTKYGERLEKQNIHTVEHFLKALYKDENSLRSSLDLKPEHKGWEKMVDHAKTCCLKDKPELKSYRCEEKNVVLFFDYVHRLVGARFGNDYIASDNFEQDQKKLVDPLKKNAYDQLDGLTGDHVMKDNIPVPIYMNTDDGAGPSCKISTAPQQINSGQHIAEHQVEGIPASEVLRPCAPHDLNYQGITTDEGPSHDLNEPSFAIGNDGPSTSLSVPYHLTTQNYQAQGTGFAVQQQNFAAVDAMTLDSQAFLQHQADNNNWGEMQQYLADWPGDETFEAAASAHICMLSMPELNNNTGATSLPNNGTMGSSGSARQDWSQCQGNMPGNTPF